MAPSLHGKEASPIPGVPYPILSPFGSPHQAWHKSHVSFKCPHYAFGVAGTPKGGVGDNFYVHQFGMEATSTILVTITL
jgi:hypothetical protein